MKPVLFFLISTLAACSSGTNDAGPQKAAVDSFAATTNHSAKSASALPSFSLQDASGRKLDLKSFAGKRIFVNLWATWCPPCRAEMPEIEKLYQRTDKDKSAFLLVSLDDKFDKAKKFVQRKSFTFPVYYPSEALPELFQVQGIPATFIFNEKGELVQRIEGAANYNTPEYRKYFGAEE